jgi:hypothetical protein
MADAEYFEIPGEGTFPNKEEALATARIIAKNTDRFLEIYKVKRTLVKTIQRQVTLSEADAPSA